MIQMSCAPAQNAGAVQDSPVENITVVEPDGLTTIDLDILEEMLEIDQNNGLTEAEIEGLLFMREEEKLARDVYLTLYDIWGEQTLQNIAKSEQNHMDAVRRLLDYYGLEDSASDKIGVFQNVYLQRFYNELTEEGKQSLADALQVGGAIEEVDILDLENYLKGTRNESIRLLYQNLLRGSRNHLRAFANTMEQRVNVTYQPQYMSQDAFDTIVGMVAGSENSSQSQDNNQDRQQKAFGYERGGGD